MPSQRDSRSVWNARPLAIYIALIVAATTCASAACAQKASSAPAAAFVQGGEYRLYTQAFAARGVSPTPALVIVLHGDSSRGTPKYHYRFAVLVADQNTDVVAVGLLRPGYVDADGNQSEGERGLTTGDNYNARNTDSIADSIQELKRRWHARKVVVVGHSGGAALTANILGRHPAVIDSAVLVSCPCDVEKWRQHMFQVRRSTIWQGRIDTLSPIDLMPHVSDRVPVRLFVGTQDDVTPPSLSVAYQAAAARLGKNVQLVQLEGKGHDALFAPAVFAALARMVNP